MYLSAIEMIAHSFLLNSMRIFSLHSHKNESMKYVER